MFHKFSKHLFLFEELVKRDFKQKYKGTVIGMAWSVLSPLLNLLVLRLVFTQFFGRGMDHYTTYLFAGTVFFSFFKEATKGGMSALTSNASIFTKINVPKYLFLLSKNVSAVINFGLTLIVFFLFAAIDGVTFGWHFLMLLYPILYLILFNVGVGLILSAMYIFFRDTKYLYDVFTLLLHYCSAIFYRVDSYPEKIQAIFLCNPVYLAIKYVRVITLEGNIPSFQYHLLMLDWVVAMVGIGALIYKKCNHKFLYYV